MSQPAAFLSPAVNYDHCVNCSSCVVAGTWDYRVQAQRCSVSGASRNCSLSWPLLWPAEMYCVSCEVRSEFMYVEGSRPTNCRSNNAAPPASITFKLKNVALISNSTPIRRTTGECLGTLKLKNIGPPPPPIVVGLTTTPLSPPFPLWFSGVSCEVRTIYVCNVDEIREKKKTASVV
jgi:hypothetical protein